MNKKLVVAISTFVAVVIVLILVTQLLSNNARSTAIRKVSDSFVAKVLDCNDNGSYDLFTKTARDSLSETTWRDQTTQLCLFFTARHATYAATASSGAKTATETVTYNITGNDGDYSFRLVLVEQQKVWGVQSFTSNRK